MITERSELPPLAQEMLAPGYKGGGMVSNAEAASVFPELAIKPDQSGRIARSTSKEGRKMDQKLTALIIKMKKVGWRSAVVINLNTFPLTLDMGYCGRRTIPGCKKGQPYVKFVIENYVVSPIEAGEGERNIEATMPVEIAAEFVRNYKLTELAGLAVAEVGVGVFWYEFDPREPNDLPEELLEQAQNLQADFYRGQFELAENLWNKNKNRSEIGDHMREAARLMKENGSISVLPEWVTASAGDNKPQAKQTCPACAAEAPAAAIFCLTCQTMFDPEKVRAIRPDIYFAQRPMEARAAGPDAKGGLVTLKNQDKQV